MRVQVLLATRATVLIRSMNSSDHMCVIRIEIRSPVPRARGITRACWVYTVQGDTATCALTPGTDRAGVTKPAKERAEGDEAACGDTEAGFDVGPDGDVGSCVCNGY